MQGQPHSFGPQGPHPQRPPQAGWGPQGPYARPPGQRPPGGPPSRQPQPKQRSVAGVVIGIVVGALVLVLAVGGGLAWWFTRDTPEKAVKRYFKELDLAGVTDMSEVTTDAPSKGSTEEKLALDIVPPDNAYSIQSVAMAGDVATVSYLGPAGTPDTVVLRMVKDHGIWKVGNGTAEVTLKVPSGVPMALTWSMYEVAPDRPHKVWPGRYKVERATSASSSLSATNFEPAVAPFTIKPGETKTVEIPIRLTAQGRTSVQNTLGQAFSKCVGPRAQSSGCPAGLGRPSGLRDFYWTPSDYAGMHHATIDEGQPVDNTCGRFPVTLTGNYTRPDGGSATSAPVSLTITGCVDARRTGESAQVAWR